MEPSHARRRRRNLRRLYRIRAMVCLAAAIVAVPALFAKSSADAQDVAIGAPQVVSIPTLPTVEPTASSTTPTTSPATTIPAPAITQAPATTVTVAPVDYKERSTTTIPVTAPPTTTPPTTAPPTTQPAPKPSHNESGIASYYNDPRGGCAHKTLPFGTVVHITASNGRTATCVVDDRGPFGAGRILDLDESIFAQLAPLGSGLVNVTATW